MTQLLPLRAARRERTIAGQQQPKIISQRAINRLFERQGKHAAGSFALRNASEKRTLSRTGACRRGRSAGIFLRVSGILALGRSPRARLWRAARHLASSCSCKEKQPCKERDRNHY